MKTLTLLLYVIYVRVNTNMALLSAIFKYGDEVGNLFIEVYHHFIEEKKIVLNGISCCTVTICLDQGNNLPQPSSITFSIRKNTDRKSVHLLIQTKCVIIIKYI